MAFRTYARLQAAIVGFMVFLIGAPLWAADAPFQRMEVRAPCAHYDPLKRPFFGETHLHTAYSFDAGAIDTRNTPAEAYQYAKGRPVGLPPWTNTRLQFQPDPEPPISPLVAQYPYCMPGERCQFMATRIAQLPEGRALDWAAITDHAEQLGEANICLFTPVKSCTSDGDCPPGQECPSGPLAGPAAGMCAPAGYTSGLCTLARDELSRLRLGAAPAIIAGMENGAEVPTRVNYCNAGPADDTGRLCLEQAKNVWDKIRLDAEAAYDRTAACTFTSLIAYEYTAMMAAGRCAEAPDLACWDNIDAAQPSADCPSGACVSTYPGSGGLDNLHRNIIFRNDDVLGLPISNLEAPVGCGKGPDCPRPYPIGSPQQLLEDLRRDCNDHPPGHPRCEALSIPHNSNLSGGAMFLMPESLDEAKVRNAMEPLVEMIQVKGASECRFLATAPGAWGAVDEECGFENMSSTA